MWSASLHLMLKIAVLCLSELLTWLVVLLDIIACVHERLASFLVNYYHSNIASEV